MLWPGTITAVTVNRVLADTLSFLPDATSGFVEAPREAERLERARSGRLTERHLMDAFCREV